MTKDTPRLLEFEKIIDRISRFAFSPATLPLIGNLAPLGSKIDTELRLAQVEEIRNLAAAGIRLPLERFEDIIGVIELVRPEGSLLGTEELSLLIPALTVSDRIRKLLLYRSDIPLLAEISADVSSFPDILEPLLQTIAPDGGIQDGASDLLFNLRKSQRQLVARIRKRLEEIVRERAVAIFLQDDFITQRNGRWVIPVRMDSKGMVPGVVHDVSRSGETAFMEPIEIIGLVNELENLNAEEKAEQIRILKEITAWIREDADAILASFTALVRLDFLNAIAGFAELIEANSPQIAEEMTLRICGGCHPLLLLFARESGRGSVVPLDLSLGGEAGARTILITGPNTGGKTIAIKVAGLLTLMAQSGIPVPADRRSVFPARARISADIGDEQSIEESLSTFSAHIRKIAAILATADERTIVLLDELGTGTDPLQGGAIACAVLAELMNKGSVVLATTHLVDIVTYVQKSPGMVNAAMEFDRQSLTPLYRLTMGEPGQSHALDIARRCGLPETIIENAARFAGTMESEFHLLLADLKAGRRENELLLAELRSRENGIGAKEQQLAKAEKETERLRREAREKGLAEAKALLNSARAELNRILEEARREKSKTAGKALADLEAELESKLEETPRPMAVEELGIGTTVYLKTLGSNAEILSIDNRHQRLRVRAGSLEVEVPLTAVAAAEAGKPEPWAPKRPRLPRQPEADYELNLIGLRVEEALLKLDKFLDIAALNALSEVRIIHGIGTGALMRGVREHLARSPHVESFRPGESFEGGDGASVVRLAR